MPTTTRSRTRARERREDVETRVLRATEELMARGSPFTELSMQRIAEHAGVARSSLYLFVADKSQLLIVLAERASAGIFDTAIEWWRGDHAAGQAGVVDAMRQMIAEFREHLHLLLALAEVSAYDLDVSRYWIGRVAGFIEVARERLAAEQQAGNVDPALDPQTTAQLLTWMVERTIAVHCRIDDGSGDERLARDLARSIWLTVYGTPSDPRR